MEKRKADLTQSSSVLKAAEKRVQDVKAQLGAENSAIAAKKEEIDKIRADELSYHHPIHELLGRTAVNACRAQDLCGD